MKLAFLRKAMIQFLFCVHYWDLGCMYIEQLHGHGYTEYICTIYFLGSQYIFFNSLHGVAARTLLKSYLDQAEPNPLLKPYEPAEANT